MDRFPSTANQYQLCGEGVFVEEIEHPSLLDEAHHLRRGRVANESNGLMLESTAFKQLPQWGTPDLKCGCG
jgi:hypothetical protein